MKLYDNQAISCRRLSTENVETIKEIVKIFRNQDISDAKAREFISNSNVIVYCAFEQESVCGYVLAYRLPRMDLGNDMLHIYHCFVDENHRRKGIATLLMNCAIEFAEKEQLHYVYLITQSDNLAAMNLYSSLGGYNHPKNKEIYYWYMNSGDLKV